jgi:hypothetical protein
LPDDGYLVQAPIAPSRRKGTKMENEEKQDGLNKLQRQHRAEIVEEAYQRIWDKYTAGAQEHQTNLKQDSTMEQLAEWAIEEAIDQVVYLLTLKSKMNG